MRVCEVGPTGDALAPPSSMLDLYLQPHATKARGSTSSGHASSHTNKGSGLPWAMKSSPTTRRTNRRDQDKVKGIWGNTRYVQGTHESLECDVVVRVCSPGHDNDDNNDNNNNNNKGITKKLTTPHCHLLNFCAKHWSATKLLTRFATPGRPDGRTTAQCVGD